MQTTVTANPDRIYSLESVSDDIQLCFVFLPELLKRYLPDVAPADFRKRTRVRFDEEISLSKFFSAEEIRTVNRFKVIKKQLEWLGGRLAVKHLAGRQFQKAAAEITVAYHEKGAPYLRDFPEFPISISHSKDLAVAALRRNRGGPIGLDVERIGDALSENFRRIAFSDAERQALVDAPVEQVYLSWTVKEAFLKYIGMGFHENLKTVEFLRNRIHHKGRPVSDVNRISRIIDDYALTLVYR